MLLSGWAPTAAVATPFSGGVEEVGYVDGAFHVRVSLDYGLGERWLVSTDGGRSWQRTGRPAALSTAPETASETWEACANDGSCYRARMVYPEGWPRDAKSRHLVERRTSGSAWVIEADLATTPALIGLAVNPADSSQAVATSWGYGFYRGPSGTWHELDLVELASDPQWVRDLLVRLASPRTTLALAIGLSILGWLLLSTLSAKWVAQLITGVVGGVLYLAGSMFFWLYAGPLLWAQAIWVTLTAVIVLLVRRQHRNADHPASGTRPGFDPPEDRKVI